MDDSAPWRRGNRRIVASLVVMPERPRPDMDAVRDAMRERDEDIPEEPPEERSDEEEEPEEEKEE